MCWMPMPPARCEAEMLNLLPLVPALPFAGFVLLGLFGRRLPRSAVAWIGAGSVGASAIVAGLVALTFLDNPPAGPGFQQTMWTWIEVGRFEPTIGFHLDALSLVMMLVVTFVGFLIHLYSAEFMGADGFSRFFAYMNLFVGFMLTLLLADNLLLLYLGWEGVGLCSYLLIGFWYKNPANGAAARKAFVVTRVGDAAMALGLFLLFDRLGTLHIQDLMQRATAEWSVGSPLAIAAAALLLGGALGKSAQLPLQTWLPDAMAGPTPVSALIHAATMVTAGVYLIARTHVLFELAPPVQLAVAWIGAVTLLLAGFSALTQWDIKRVLAYSTISQIGYMFLALGVGAWAAGIFHFLTHAFFKALLFLAAGAVIHALEEEHNIFKMGGLWRQMPLTFWTFLAGAGALAAIPLVTSGFYSKDLILSDAWRSARGGPWLWLAGIIGALLTGIYTFRMVFVTFFGEAKHSPQHRPRGRMGTALVVLAIGAVGAGFLKWRLIPFLNSALPSFTARAGGGGEETMLEIVAAAAALAGVAVAYVLYLSHPRWVEQVVATPWGGILHRWWFSDWGFDWLYDTFIVRPYSWIARLNRNDVVDSIYRFAAWLMRCLNYAVRVTQNGKLRWYTAGIVIGAIILVGMVVLR
jgi:NADH-quinone oxidoreductase subunit L